MKKMKFRIIYIFSCILCLISCKETSFTAMDTYGYDPSERKYFPLNVQDCFTYAEKKQLVEKVYNLKRVKFSPQLFISSSIANDSLCIGLYEYECVKNRSIFGSKFYKVLKFKDGLCVHNSKKRKQNREQIEYFRQQYNDCFSTDELNEIEKEFLEGTYETINIGGHH